MKLQFAKATIVIAIVIVVFSTISTSLAEDSKISYQLLNRPDGTVTYELNVVIPQSLYDYYREKSHKLASSGDFAHFVTPYSLKPIADRLGEIYKDEEDYANGVLMLVHQITYEATAPEKFPAETMVDGKGDCDLLSFIAASILKAGGFDVVLLYYEKQTHMNLGIHLSNAPKDARNGVYYVTNNGVKYYVAESTGGEWKEGWRVGENPPDFRQVSAQVITLEDAEQVAPGQVSASFASTEPSTLSLDVSPGISVQNSAVTFRGQVAPETANANVTFYAKVNDSPWAVIGTVLTQSDGRFEYVWKTETAGLIAVRAGWSGDKLYTGAMSRTKSATVIPLFLFGLLTIAILSAIIGVFAIFMQKHAQQEST